MLKKQVHLNEFELNEDKEIYFVSEFLDKTFYKAILLSLLYLRCLVNLYNSLDLLPYNFYRAIQKIIYSCLFNSKSVSHD